jgi:hypothetical protein
VKSESAERWPIHGERPPQPFEDKYSLVARDRCQGAAVRSRSECIDRVESSANLQRCQNSNKNSSLSAIGKAAASGPTAAADPKDQGQLLCNLPTRRIRDELSRRRTSQSGTVLTRLDRVSVDIAT